MVGAGDRTPDGVAEDLGRSFEPAVGGPSRADQLVDDLVPAELDWRHLVTSYPLLSLGLAVAGGYVLGRSRGRLIVTALSAYAADSVARNINGLVGEEIL